MLLSEWAEQIPAGEWSVYGHVLEALSNQRLRFALGGAFALAAYAGLWRNTKDMDVYVLPEDRDEFVLLLNRLGGRDLYDERHYDRRWIYRATFADTIVDVIWSMANQRADVDERWLMHGPELLLRGHRVRVLAIEELIWAKLYVMQKDRCDWPDIINLLYCSGAEIDWEHLMTRVGEDLPLLRGVLDIYRWLCPQLSHPLPLDLVDEVSGAFQPSTDSECRKRVNLLDSRDWFSAAV